MSTTAKKSSKELRSRISKLNTPTLIKRYNEGKFVSPKESKLALHFLSERNVLDKVNVKTTQEPLIQRDLNVFKYNNKVQEQILFHVLEKNSISNFEKENKNIIVDNKVLSEAHEQYNKLREANNIRYKKEVTDKYKARKLEIMKLEGLKKMSDVYKLAKYNTELRAYFKELQDKFEIEFKLN